MLLAWGARAWVGGSAGGLRGWFCVHDVEIVGLSPRVVCVQAVAPSSSSSGGVSAGDVLVLADPRAPAGGPSAYSMTTGLGVALPAGGVGVSWRPLAELRDEEAAGLAAGAQCSACGLCVTAAAARTGPP